MERYRDIGRRHVALDDKTPLRRLLRLGRYAPGRLRPVGYRAEPPPGKVDHAPLLHIGRHGEYRLRGLVVAVVEASYILYRRPGYMVGRHAYRRPTVGVHLICQRAQQHRLVAVWLVEITLLILLDDHRLLGGARLGREVEVAHAVALQPQRRLDILSRQRYVEIGVVVVGKGVVLSASHLYRYVEVGHVARAAEHQMLEQVGEPRMFGILVACSDLVQNVDGRELRRSVAVDRNRKAVVESGCFVSYHNTKITFFVPQ